MTHIEYAVRRRDEQNNLLTVLLEDFGNQLTGLGMGF